ncbi:RING/U-box superfamily protein with ARM repeat domain-containing protein [Actinidia rufa]|uniref:RING-type E3 ubiquitin transferase n=1 Tax=Actinidia rufa TaxID=165716 RepID=A0A7J0DY04_9ERIC|nr:RING/U-box superfamily protein with ARM repeat domain-containing protein [Actinidia rufa]
MGSGKRRWRISLHWSPSAIKKQPPKEFTCPLSGSLMADPVIVSSGQTFERNCIQTCKSIGFKPVLSDGSKPDFTTIIPNLALKSTILNWCNTHLTDQPKPIDSISAQKLIRALMASQKQQSEEKKLIHPRSELTLSSRLSSSSDESVAVATSGSTTPLPLATRPSCYSYSSSSDVETLNPSSAEEIDIVGRLKSSHVFEQEEAVISLRKITRSREDTRGHLCTPRLLSAVRSLIASRYATLQVNAVAALVNLSLENENKVKIVRSGIILPLIDVLKGGFPEAQEHAAGAIFSLSLDDQNKIAIGVLGALPPLLHALRSESERARHDSALALYHLSLVQSNRSKLVKLGEDGYAGWGCSGVSGGDAGSERVGIRVDSGELCGGVVWIEPWRFEVQGASEGGRGRGCVEEGGGGRDRAGKGEGEAGIGGYEREGGGGVGLGRFTQLELESDISSCFMEEQQMGIVSPVDVTGGLGGDSQIKHRLQESNKYSRRLTPIMKVTILFGLWSSSGPKRLQSSSPLV